MFQRKRGVVLNFGYVGKANIVCLSVMSCGTKKMRVGMSMGPGGVCFIGVCIKYTIHSIYLSTDTVYLSSRRSADSGA